MGRHLDTLLVRNAHPILTVKTENRQPVERPFGREFSAIYNHLRSYDGLKSQDLEILLAIFAGVVEKQSLSNCRYCADRA